MGHLYSRNQAKYQAKAARDIPGLPGSGESAVISNLMGFLENESSPTVKTSPVQGKTIELLKIFMKKFAVITYHVIYSHTGVAQVQHIEGGGLGEGEKNSDFNRKLLQGYRRRIFWLFSKNQSCVLQQALPTWNDSEYAVDL